MEVRALPPTHDTHSMTWVGIMDFEYKGKVLHGGFFSLPRISVLATP